MCNSERAFHSRVLRWGQMDNKVRVLILALREAAVIVVAALEDYLEMPYDNSALRKRSMKVKQ